MTSRWIDPPVLITDFVRDNTFHNYSLAAYLPVGATMIIARLINTSGTAAYGINVHHPDTQWTNNDSVYTGCIVMHIAGVNASREVAIKCAVTSTTTQIFLQGFFGGEAVNLNPLVDISASLTRDSTWRTLDLSASIPAGAIAAIIVDHSVTAYGAWRATGSTDDIFPTGGSLGMQSWIVPLDVNRTCQYKFTVAAIKLRLAGYLTSGMAFNTNAVNRSTATVGVYEDIAALPSEATGGLYICRQATTTARSYGLRKKGDTTDIYRGNYYMWQMASQADVNRVVQQKISATSADVYEFGYFTSDPILGGVSSRRRRPMLGVGI